MIFSVRMLAYHPNHVVRLVDVPDEAIPDNADTHQVLERVFHYGQNDFCQGDNADVIRKTTCSVSVGDVIELEDGSNYIVKPAGFGLLTKEEYDDYKDMHRVDRVTHAYTLRG